MCLVLVQLMLVFTFLQSTTHLGDQWLCLIERNSMIPAVFSLTFTRGYSTKFYAGRLHRPMYTIFDGKGTPVAGIHIPSIDKWYSFHELFIELCIPINCCKWTVFKIWINHKTRMFFSTISQPKKFICKPFWFFFNWSKWQISLPSHILQQVKSRYFHIPEAWNRYPFRAEPPLMGNYREYPRGPLCRCVTGTPSWPNCF